MHEIPSKVLSFNDTTKVHVVFHGNMSIAKIFFDKELAWKFAADNETDGYLLPVESHNVES
jgi:hypothetical protein